MNYLMKINGKKKAHLKKQKEYTH